MCMTYYTVDDLRPGRPGWDVRQFSALAEAIDHYRTLPMNGVRVLGMADDAHAYELIRCVRLFPGDAQGEDVLAADYRRSGLTKKNAALKNALDVCLEVLHPRFLLEPERLVPVPHRRKLREELREALLWQGYEENYDSAIRSVFVGGVGWISPQDVKKQRHLPLVLSYRVDGMSKDGAYLSLELEPWEYDLLLEQTKNHYAAYHVTERGQEWYFKTSPGEELLDAAEKLRGYVTAEKGTAPDLFIKMFADGRPITAQEYNALTALRMENTGKVRGVFDVNFDKREFSAVRIMDGWRTWAMRDVSAAVYHATRSQFASSDDKWRKLLDHLSGKEITSAGHLSARNFSFGDEIIESNGKLNFYVQTEFDVDAAFGTFVLTDENDDWLNVYANYDIAEDRPCDTLELTLCKGDGSEESWSYQLNAAEQDVLLRKMGEYCQQQTGMSLHDYAQQFREEPEQQQGPVMKL